MSAEDQVDATAAEAGPESGDSGPSGLFDAEFLRKLERLELVARKVFRGMTRGEHATRRRGRGLEFADFRQYQPGDDLRYIDWNIFSRLDRLFLKLYTTEEDLTLHIAIDASASMAFGSPSKFDYARQLAASLAYVGLNNLDRVSVSSFPASSGPALASLKSRRQIRSVLSYLEGLTAGGVTSLDAAIAPGLGSGVASRSGGLVVVISDVLSDEHVARAMESIRGEGRDAVLIQVLAEEEIDPPLDGAYRLVDAEDGTTLRISIDEDLRAAYQQRLNDWLGEIEVAATRSNVDYVRATTAIPFEDLLLKYLRQGRHWR